MNNYIVNTYLKCSGGFGNKLSYKVHYHTHEINSEYALTENDLTERVAKLLHINKDDYEFVISDVSYKKLTQDFITLENNYEMALDKIEKLENQIRDKDRYIQRLNLEAQRYFEMSMDLLYPNKEEI